MKAVWLHAMSTLSSQVLAPSYQSLAVSSSDHPTSFSIRSTEHQRS